MRNEGPDPLNIREMNAQHWANERACNNYYLGDIWTSTSEGGMFFRLEIESNPVTQWRRSQRECYAELADKIRAWEKDNPELAIKDEQPCKPSS